MEINGLPRHVVEELNGPKIVRQKPSERLGLILCTVMMAIAKSVNNGSKERSAILRFEPSK